MGEDGMGWDKGGRREKGLQIRQEGAGGRVVRGGVVRGILGCAINGGSGKWHCDVGHSNVEKWRVSRGRMEGSNGIGNLLV